MATLASSTRRNQLALSLIEANQFNAAGGTILGPEGSAIEANASLHANQVRPESGGK